MFYVYLLVSENGRRYIGFTRDLERGLEEHREGKVRSTRGGERWRLEYYEAYREEGLARKRERKLKREWRLRAALYRRLGL